MLTAKQILLWLMMISLSLSFLSGCSTFFPPAPTPTPTFTNTPEPTVTPTFTPIPPTPTLEPTLPPTNTPFPTVPPPPTLAPSPTPGGKPIYIYFIEKEKGLTGCADAIVALTSGKYRVNTVELDVQTALTQLFAYHALEWGSLYNALALSQLAVVKVEVDASNRVVVDLSGDIKLSDDKCDRNRAHTQMLATIRQFPNVTGVSILLNGIGIKNFLY